MLTSVSSGGIAGFLIGYALKKGIKIILGIAGLFLGALAYLNYKGLVTVDWERIASVSNKAISELSLGSANYASSDRKSTRLNSSHANISYAVFCLKKNNYLLLFL